MDGQENWDPRPPYGMNQQYGQGYNPSPRQSYGSSAPNQGYDFNRISTSPLYGSDPMSDYGMGPAIDDEGAKGLGIASMIIGICSLGMSFFGLVFSGFCVISLIASIVGVALGGVSLGKYKRTGATEGRGMAITGVVTNSINLILAIVGILLIILFIGMFMSSGI